MSYTVKLAVFPPWKAPIPYESLPGTFASCAKAAEAGARALTTIIESELIELSCDLRSRLERAGEKWVTSVTVPASAVHGYVIFDEGGTEVSNWTTLDAALDQADHGSSEDFCDSFSAPDQSYNSP